MLQAINIIEIRCNAWLNNVKLQYGKTIRETCVAGEIYSDLPRPTYPLVASNMEIHLMIIVFDIV